MKKLFTATLLTVLTLSLALSGCAQQKPDVADPTSSSQTNTGAPTQPSSASLPDGVVLPDGAKLVDGPTPAVTVNGVSGWSALALGAEGDKSTNMATELRQKLTAAGWTVDKLGTAEINATNKVGMWLQISITQPKETNTPLVEKKKKKTA